MVSEKIPILNRTLKLKRAKSWDFLFVSLFRLVYLIISSQQNGIISKKIIICLIFLLSSFLSNAQLRSDFFLSTGFGPAAMKTDVKGNVHIIWADGDNRTIYYQLFDSLMNPQKEKIRISSKPNALPGYPRLTVNDKYVIAVWDAMLYSISRWGVFGRILKIDGDTLSSELRIDYQDSSISLERNPDVISFNDTTYLVTWFGNANRGEVYTLVGRVGNIFSGPLNKEIYMSEDIPSFGGGGGRTINGKRYNDFFCLFGGIFDQDTSSIKRIYYRIFNLDGTPKMPSTLMIKDTASVKIWQPSLSYNPSGKYTIIWPEKRDSVWNINMTNYDLNGNSDGNIIRVNSDSNVVSSYPSVDIDFSSNGESIIVWEGIDNGKVRIYGQRFSSDCSKTGNNFKISTSPVNSDHYWPIVQLHNNKIITLWYTYIDSLRKGQLWSNVLNFDNPVTSVLDNDNFKNKIFELKQNYPNPFNPTTTIKYEMPKAAYVRLVVYDMLGREVATLVNEFKPGGRYSVTFNAGNLSSGIYIYQLRSGSFIANKKLVLLR